MTGSSKTGRRQESILARLRATQREWRVEELAAALTVKELTIRRDLTTLAEQGVILRTHGGCLAAARAAQESEYHERVAHNFELKRAIGRVAAAEVMPQSTVLLNDGSTTFHLAAPLGGCAPLTVYTNSIAMIAELSRFAGLELYVLGGRYNSQLHYLGGTLTERVLEFLEFDTVFLGADAVGRDGQCQVFNSEEARTAQIMLRRGRRKILLADHTKTTVTGNVAYATLADFDLWVTTRGIAPARLRHFRTLTTVREA